MPHPQTLSVEYGEPMARADELRAPLPNGDTQPDPSGVRERRQGFYGSHTGESRATQPRRKTNTNKRRSCRTGTVACRCRAVKPSGVQEDWARDQAGGVRLDPNYQLRISAA